MAAVDPYDDTIERFVVFHYRFDPERNERRNVIVAAFDTRRECTDFMTQEASALRLAIDRGDAEPVESMSGTRVARRLSRSRCREKARAPEAIAVAPGVASIRSAPVLVLDVVVFSSITT